MKIPNVKNISSYLYGQRQLNHFISLLLVLHLQANVFLPWCERFSFALSDKERKSLAGDTMLAQTLI